MGVLDRFERRLEGLVSGAFARAFKSEVQPIEIAGALQRECDDRLAPYADALAFEFAGVVQEYAAEQHYQFVGPVEVHLERADDLDTGMFRVKSRVVPGVMPMSEPAPVRQPTAWLEINGQPHGLTKPVVVIGRGSDVDLRIDDPGISRRHAEIRAGFTTTVTDLGSTNGTLLNGGSVSQAQLEDGDQIMLGNTILIYRREAG
jgi:hypothetical protein